MNTKKTQHPEIHFRVMDLIHKKPNISQRELARETGISLGSLHYCLKALIQKGWVKVSNFNKQRDKSVYWYLLTSDGVIQKSKLAIDFLRTKKIEYDKLRREIEKLSRELE
jgi:EPS-associated MarR family transcriptional regulator